MVGDLRKKAKREGKRGLFVRIPAKQRRPNFFAYLFLLRFLRQRLMWLEEKEAAGPTRKCRITALGDGEDEGRKTDEPDAPERVEGCLLLFFWTA